MILGIALVVLSAVASPGNERVALVLPARRAPGVSLPAAPPALPPELRHIEPLTLEIIVSRTPQSGRAQTIRQTITRTAERVHVATVDRQEWLFERNPVDPRRVSAFLIDHAGRTIVIYEESDLRLTLGIRGWADVLQAFDPAAASIGPDRDGVTRFSIERITKGVKPALLSPPSSRFPAYRVVDLAAWLEHR